MAKKVAISKKRISAVDRFLALPDAEKDRVASRFDAEFVAEQSRPLNAAERRQWAKARRRPGRPKVGLGAKVISISVERGLLKQADALAKKQRISRAELVAKSLNATLAQAFGAAGRG